MTFFTLNDFVAIGEAGFDVGPISLSLNAGEILAIVGATGSGKTLLLESIAHLLPHRGERQMPSTNQEENKVGMVFQNHALLDELTVLENVALAATCAQLSNPNERACEQLANVDLLDAKDQKPAEISGGMKRRCGLARAMVTDPSLLLCDEVTAGLDPLTTQKIFSLIQHFVKGREGNIYSFW